MTPMLSRALIPLLLMTTALGTQAMAQSRPIALGEIVVEADGSGQDVATVRTTTGSKVAVAVTQVPQSVSVVGRKQLDANPGAKASETLRYTAGVSTQTYGTDADTDWFYVRGFQAEQNGMFLDNLSLYQSSFGTFMIDPFLLERIEVLKGPSSVLYGGANPGGIVNYVSKRPTGERLVYTETGINNFGNAYVGFDIGDSIGDTSAAYRLTGKLSGGGYETKEAKDLRGVVQGSVKVSPSADTDLTLYGSYQRVGLTHTSTGFLPYVGTVVDAPGGVRIPRNFFYGEPGSDVYDRQQTMLGYELEHDINGDWIVRQNVRYANVGLKEDFVYGNGDLTGTSLPRIRFAHDSSVNTLSIDTQLAGTVETGPIEHNLLFGVDYKYYSLVQRQGSNPWPTVLAPIDVLNPIYGAPLLATADYLNTDTTLNQLGFYAQDQMKLNGFIATLNGRYDAVWIDIKDKMAPAKSSSTTQGVFTGRAGLGYEFDNGLTPYVSYATSFNPTLSTDFLTGKQYTAETGRQWEAGVKYAPTGFDGLITASVFDITRDNVLGPDPLNPLITAPVGQVNVRGAEFEAQVNIENFTVTGALTYLEAKVLQATGTTAVGKSPVQIPTLTASLGVDYTFHDGSLDGLTVGGGVRVLGESWADNANTAKVPATTLFDASLRYEKDDWGVTLAVSNIFDTSYVASCQSMTVCGYGAGRTATLSLSKKW